MEYGFSTDEVCIALAHYRGILFEEGDSFILRTIERPEKNIVLLLEKIEKKD
jgi:hypothetical protein